MASGKCMATLQTGHVAQEDDDDDVGDDADVGDEVDAELPGAEEMRQMRADLDELASENRRLRESVAMHGEMHRTTSAIVKELHENRTVAVAGSECKPDTTCTCGNCQWCLRNKSAKVADKAKTVGRESSSDAHARILSMLQSDVKSSNAARQNRRT